MKDKNRKNCLYIKTFRSSLVNLLRPQESGRNAPGTKNQKKILMAKPIDNLASLSIFVKFEMCAWANAIKLISIMEEGEHPNQK